MRTKIAACLFLIILSHGAYAQNFSTYDKNEELFLYEVKIIDEFIERFNDDKSSFLRKEYEKQNKPYRISRKQLLTSLFNWENPRWERDTAAREFFVNVLDTTRPRYLHFTDTNWYAEVKCTFQHDTGKVMIPLILHIERTKKGSRWIIAGIGKNKILNDNFQTAIPGHKAKDTAIIRYIPTTSYATNFVEFTKILTDSMVPADYFDPKLLQSGRAKHFVNLVLQNKLHFLYATDIRFHFYQLPNWIFITEQFNRKDINSGWLINDLIKVSKDEKEVYRKKLLNM